MQNQTSAAPDGLAVASGYGIKLYVNRGHLVIHDGIGRQRETRRFHRATSGLKRVLVIGHTGSVTFEALRWLRDIGAAYIQLDQDGQLLAVTTNVGSNRPALRRAQALAATSAVGVKLARSILTTKVAGQASLLPELPGEASAQATIAQSQEALASAAELSELVAAEAVAAAAYWEAWSTLPVAWGKRTSQQPPEHWRAFRQRHSELSRSPRLATNPANAILNYLYALLEAETTLACHAVGLDPGLGIFHADVRARDSLALDLMEAGRPAVDAYLLAMLTTRTFRTNDFAETRRGACRLNAQLASELAATTPTWRKHIASVAEFAAARLAGSQGLASPTPLTQATRRAVWDDRRSKQRARIPPVPRLEASCADCGAPLTKRTRTICEACHRQRFGEVGPKGRTEAARVLAQLRAGGADPRHGGEAARRRGEKNAAHQRAIAEWKPASTVVYDAEEFRKRLLPLLRSEKIEALVEATGLSPHYCSLIRLGKRVPHPRHWSHLANLVGRLEGSAVRALTE